MRQEIWTSDITRLEVLGYHSLSENDREDLTNLFSLAIVCPVSSSVIDLAIELRQKRKMSLGDAIIAATALENRQTLATRNASDFEWIEGLKVVDPLSGSV